MPPAPCTKNSWPTDGRMSISTTDGRRIRVRPTAGSSRTKNSRISKASATTSTPLGSNSASTPRPGPRPAEIIRGATGMNSPTPGLGPNGAWITSNTTIAATCKSKGTPRKRRSRNPTWSCARRWIRSTGISSTAWATGLPTCGTGAPKPAATCGVRPATSPMNGTW